MGEAKHIILHVPKEEMPLIMGYKKSGLRHIETITGAMIKDIMPDDSIPAGEVAFKIL